MVNKSIDLVFHSAQLDHFQERDWINFLFSKIKFNEYTINNWKPKNEILSIHIFSSNDKIEFNFAKDLFLSFQNQNISYAIFHLSDEWAREDTSFYRGAKFCLRINWCPFISNPAIFYIPWGPVHYFSMPVSSSVLIASKRKYLASFVGRIKQARPELEKHFGNQSKFFIYDSGKDKKITHHEYYNAYFQSIFTLCPNGNANPETARFYEALECGSIPITEHSFSIDYYKELLGPNPIPSFRSWSKAKEWILKNNEEKFLDQLQQEVNNWWKAKKNSYQDLIPKMINNNSNSLNSYNSPYKGISLSIMWRFHLLRYLKLKYFPKRIFNLIKKKFFL